MPWSLKFEHFKQTHQNTAFRPLVLSIAALKAKWTNFRSNLDNLMKTLFLLVWVSGCHVWYGVLTWITCLISTWSASISSDCSSELCTMALCTPARIQLKWNLTNECEQEPNEGESMFTMQIRYLIILMSLNLHVLCDANTCIYVYVHVLSSPIPSVRHPGKVWEPTPSILRMEHWCLQMEQRAVCRLMKDAGNPCSDRKVLAQTCYNATIPWTLDFASMSCSLYTQGWIDSNARSCQEHTAVTKMDGTIYTVIMITKTDWFFEPTMNNSSFNFNTSGF